jgi:hypothetical protein
MKSALRENAMLNEGLMMLFLSPQVKTYTNNEPVIKERSH